MKAPTIPLSIKLLYLLSKIAFWLMVTASVIFSAFYLAFIAGATDGATKLHIMMPLPVTVLETGTLTLDGTPIPVTISEAYGKISFEDQPRILNEWALPFLFVVFGLGLFMTSRIHNFMRTLAEGNYFDLHNIALLKQLSYSLIALWFFAKIYLFLLASWVEPLSFQTIRLGSEIKGDQTLLYVALVVWALAHVFMKGVEMKEEQELTI